MYAVRKNIFNQGNWNKLCYIDMGLYLCSTTHLTRQVKKIQKEKRKTFTHKCTRYESHLLHSI